MAAIFGSIIVAAVIITVMVGARRGSDEPNRNTAESGDFYSQMATGESSMLTQKPFLFDFIIYEDRMEESFTETIRFREVLDSWSSEMVEQFWTDPKIIAVDLMEMESQKVIKDIFADVK
ncbi:MAG: hypothetical protein JEZ04_01970 [Spirochaetales bacterium]|nr:hypothetical protein [Spirochaetales bacterium]